MADSGGRFAFGALIGLICILYGIRADESCTIDVENVLKKLLAPQDTLSLQVQALRRGLERKIVEALDREAQEEDALQRKRSMASLAAWNNMPIQKKNLESLARAGYIRTLPMEQGEDANYKRSIANMAKNGQLPLKNDDEKRGLEALARNGDLHPRRDIQDLIDDLYGKRNIGSLARNNYWPLSGKRSISSLAKSGGFDFGKRSIASLARDGSLMGKRDPQGDYATGDDKEDKRSLQSIKAQYQPKYKRSLDGAERGKRQADYYYDNEEYPSPTMQNAYDYDDILQDLNTQPYESADKRFLGRLPQMGKPKSTPTPKVRRYQ